MDSFDRQKSGTVIPSISPIVIGPQSVHALLYSKLVSLKNERESVWKVKIYQDDFSNSNHLQSFLLHSLPQRQARVAAEENEAESSQGHGEADQMPLDKENAKYLYPLS